MCSATNTNAPSAPFDLQQHRTIHLQQKENRIKSQCMSVWNNDCTIMWLTAWLTKWPTRLETVWPDKVTFICLGAKIWLLHFNKVSKYWCLLQNCLFLLNLKRNGLTSYLVFFYCLNTQSKHKSLVTSISRTVVFSRAERVPIWSPLWRGTTVGRPWKWPGRPETCWGATASLTSITSSDTSSTWSQSTRTKVSTRRQGILIPALRPTTRMHQ